MKMTFAAIAVFLLAGCATPEPAISRAPGPETGKLPIRVMLLGTYHFDNPGLDLVNSTADDVLTATRQRELAHLANQLGRFKPTAIAIEAIRPASGFLDTGFTHFTPADLASDRNEVVQIGYRLAYQQGVDRVYAVDEQEGEIDFFPFDRIQSFSAKAGKGEYVEQLIASVEADAEMVMQDQETTSVSELLARYNDPELTQRMHAAFYYGLLPLADTDEHPGAALNYGWYARNAMIFSNIAATTRPGDRVVVIYGAGHNYWLRHFIQTTPGFELVEPLPYLRDQATASTATNGS